jgi:tetratricopeptide (TPR) repeat protein
MALLADRVAWAGSTETHEREAARVATKQATAAYNLGHYDEAVSLYEAAYKLVPDPILLYDVGQSYRQANKLDKALTAYRSYLRTASEDAPNRERVEAWIRQLERTISLQKEKVAQEAAQEPPAPAVPALTVPKASEPEIAHEQIPSPKAAEEKEPTAVPAPAPKSGPDFGGQPAPQPSDAKQGWWLGRTWTWIAAGATVLLGGGALAADLAMYSKINSSKSSPCGPDKYCYSTSDADAINARMVTAEVLGALAAAAAVTTGLLFYFEGRPVRVVPVVGEMTGALARVEF